MAAREPSFFSGGFGGLTLSFTLALPVFYLFYIFTSPDVMFSTSVYLLAAGLVLVALVSAWVLLAVLNNPRPRFGASLFTLFLVLFMLMGIVDQKAMVNANIEHASLLTIEFEKEKAEKEAEIEALLAAGHGENVGEELFTETCMQCHRFDERLVGPPLSKVLGPYESNIDALEAFLASPSKKNPDYPPMPSPGLSSSQVNAVAEYVLEEYKTRLRGTPAGDATDE